MHKHNRTLKVIMLVFFMAAIIIGIYVIARFMLFGETKREDRQISQNIASQAQKDTSETQSETVNEQAEFNKGGYYYKQLGDNEKKIYADLAEGCWNYSAKVDVDVPLDSLYTAAFAMISDHPELYWADKYSVTYSGDRAVSVEYEVPEDAQAVSAEILSRGQEIIRAVDAGASEYETVKFFYEWIIDNVDYGTSDNDQDIRSVFMDGTSVCAGYSKAFLYLCNLADIECAYVRGYARSSSHAWNIVRLDGTYYWVDVTWGDPVFIEAENMSESASNLNYNYFCVTDDEMFRNHTVNLTLSSFGDVDYDEIFTFPECSDTSLNYYRLKGVYFEYYDWDTIVSYVADLLTEGIYENIELMFESSEQYNEAYGDMFYREESLIKSAIEQGMPDFFGSYYCEYSSNEDLNYIVFSLYFE